MNKEHHQPLARYVANNCVADYDAYDNNLKSASREVGVRSLYLEQRLKECLATFHEAEIPVIVMKGCHLMKSVYPFGIRPIDDIDFLIDIQHFDQADALIQSLGYEDLTKGYDRWTHINIANKITYVNDGKPEIPIDLHFTLGPFPYLGRLTYQQLFETAETLRDGESEFKVLSLEFLFLHLCLHLYQHKNEHWHVSAYDLGALTYQCRDRIDWDLVYAYIEEFEFKLPILYSLERAETLVHLAIPETFLSRLKALPETEKEQRIFRASYVMVEGLEKHIVQFITIPSLKVKLACLYHILLPSKDFLRTYFKGNYVTYFGQLIKMGLKALRHTEA